MALQINSTHPGKSPNTLYDQGKLMMACLEWVSTRVHISRFGHHGRESGPALLDDLVQAEVMKSCAISEPWFGSTHQTNVLREKQGGSLWFQLAFGHGTREVCAEKESQLQVSIHTICQLQLRYWISAPCSASFCLCRIALALSSESSAARVMLSRTGPIRGPTVVLGPPNHWARPRGAAASTSMLVRSTWPLSTGDVPLGESLSESFPDMVREVGGTGARLIRGRELAFPKDTGACTSA